MNRQEAIKFLSNTKVYVDGRSREIQHKLFNVGFKWKGCVNDVIHEWEPYLYLYSDNGDLYLKHGDSMKDFKEDPFREITADDILQIKIQEAGKNYEIGERIPFGRLTLEVVEQDICEECFFSELPEDLDCHVLQPCIGCCCAKERKDNKPVVFKRVE
ncbi:MAG: hypothetical protein ACI36Z_09265 [Alloprevotella sp.]